MKSFLLRCLRRAAPALLPWLLAPVGGFAQAPGTVDRNFLPGSTVNDSVRALLPLAEGRFYLGGGFTAIQGTTAQEIVRLNPDGSVDDTFKTGAGVGDRLNTTPPREVFGWVNALGEQRDGGLVVGGNFDRFGGTMRDRLARLRADGSLDPDFDPAAHCLGGIISGFTILPDDRLLLWGSFTNVWNEPRHLLVRLHPDGTLDPGFVPAAELAGQSVPAAVHRMPDGKLMVAGNYPALGRLIRLHPDGRLDPTFAYRLGDGSTIRALASLPDGKLLVGGSLTAAGLPSRNLVRLQPDGEPDLSFRPDAAVQGVRSIARQPDGKIVLAGGMSEGAGVVRLLADGTVDAAFGTGGFVATDGNPVSAVAVKADGGILMCGPFSAVGGVQRRLWAGLKEDGGVDPALNSASGIAGFVFQAVPVADREVMILGSFTNVQGSFRPGVARLKADGGLDLGYEPSLRPLVSVFGGRDEIFSQTAAFPDGRVLLAGLFQEEGSPVRWVSLAGLQRDGTLDPGFHRPAFQMSSGAPAQAQPDLLVPTADGSLLVVGGNVGFIDDHPMSHLGRLHRDGTVDTGFTLAPDFIAATVGPHAYRLNSVEGLTPLPDGRIVLVGGVSSLEAGAPYRALLARLNTDGSRDAGFAMAGLGKPGAGVRIKGFRLCVQTDGKVLVAGDFSHINGALRPAGGTIVRFHADGSLDDSFAPQLDAGPSVIVQDQDGHLLVAGSFTRVNGVARRGIARLNLDGTLDAGFDPGAGAHPQTAFDRGSVGQIYSLATDSGGGILAGGWFTGFDGFAADNVVRLFGGDHVPPLEPRLIRWVGPRGNGDPFQVEVRTGRGQTVHLEASPNMAPGTWNRVATRVADGDSVTFTDPAADVGQRFYRAISP